MPADTDPSLHDVNRAMVEAVREDPQRLRAVLRARFSTPTMAPLVGSYWIDAGLFAEARAAFLGNPQLNYEGQLALAEGRLDEAVRLLELGLKVFYGFGNPGRFRIARKLGEALLGKGESERAIAMLEAETARRAGTISGPSSGYEWLNARATLADAYRAANRHTEALAVESELRALLALADDDHPIARRLEGGAREAPARSESERR
jgi:hypothetical protein